MNFQIRRSTPLFVLFAPRPFPLRGRPAQTLRSAHGFGNSQASGEGNCGGQFSLRKLNPVLRKMLVLGDGFGQLEPPHHLKGKAVGQTQFSAARLAAALRGLRVQPFIHKFNPAQWQHYVQKILHGVPTEPVLHQGPGFMHHIVRSHQQPLFPLRALKCDPGNRMKRIVRVQNSVEPRCVNKDRFHNGATAQSAAAAANP